MCTMSEQAKVWPMHACMSRAAVSRLYLSSSFVVLDAVVAVDRPAKLFKELRHGAITM